MTNKTNLAFLESMPTPDLYEEKKPLFEPCKLLIERRLGHHGIRRPITLTIQDLKPIISFIHLSTEREKWQRLHELILDLSNDRESDSPSVPLLEVTGLDAAIPVNGDSINLNGTIALAYDREALQRWSEDLKERTRRALRRRGRGYLTYELTDRGPIIHFHEELISIRGNDSLEAKIFCLLIGDSVRNDELELMSIQSFAGIDEETSLLADPAFQWGNAVEERVLARIIFYGEWRRASKGERSKLIKRIQSAIIRMNKKFPSQRLIVIEEDRMVKIRRP